MAVGGDITEISDNHPELGSFVYKVQAGQDNTYDTGGYRTNDDANMITGGREAIWQINGKMGFLQANIVNDMSQKVAERLSQLAAHPLPSTWTFSCINRVSYRGQGKPVGDISANINSTIMALKVAAPEFKQL